jgi:hypothetical protein
VSDIVEQLRRTLQARRGVDYGCTWKDIKVAIEQGLGVKDGDHIGSIELGVISFGSGLIVREEDLNGEVNIKETSYGAHSTGDVR